MTQQEIEAVSDKIIRCLRCGKRIYCCDLVVKIILDEDWGVAHTWSGCFSWREDLVVWSGTAGELVRIELS